MVAGFLLPVDGQSITVILHGQGQFLDAALQFEHQMPGPAVAQRVGNSLLGRAVQSQRVLGVERRQLAGFEAQRQLHIRMGLASSFSQIHQRLAQAKAVQDERRQPGNQPMHRVVQPG